MYSWDPCAEYVGNYFAHPVNCSLYFHCQNSHSILRTCAPGLVFDFRNTVCVKESSDTPCPDPSKAPPEPTKEDIGEKVETATTPEPTPTKKTSAEVVKKPASMNSTNTLRPSKSENGDDCYTQFYNKYFCLIIWLFFKIMDRFTAFVRQYLDLW